MPRNTMTYFPQATTQRQPAMTSGLLGSARPGIMRDILWNRPVFKAPVLSNPRIAFDPLPFTASRITRRSPQR